MPTTNKNTGLGRGFDVLIPKDFDDPILAEAGERIQKLALGQVHPNPNQPRKHFEEGPLAELAASIKQYGILQPLVVTQDTDGYMIIAGERRWRASALAGLTHVPTIVRSSQELEQLEIGLIENVQRVDLSPLEQAISIERLHQQFSMSYGDIAERLGKAATTVNNIVRLLQLPPAAKDALIQGVISEGHARAILALKDWPDKQADLLKGISRYGWSVRQAEQFVTSTKRGAQSTQEAKAHMEPRTRQTEQLSKFVAAPVSIKHTAKGGRLEIHFSSEQDLARIIETLLK